VSVTNSSTSTSDGASSIGRHPPYFPRNPRMRAYPHLPAVLKRGPTSNAKYATTTLMFSLAEPRRPACQHGFVTVRQSDFVQCIDRHSRAHGSACHARLPVSGSRRLRRDLLNKPDDAAAQFRVCDAHERFIKNRPSDVAKKSVT
jgi:hypothetical protein